MKKSVAAVAAAAVVMVSAVMLRAMLAAIVSLGVMIANGVGVIIQLSGKIGSDSLVGRAGNSGVEFNTGSVQRILGTHSDAAADERVHVQNVQNAGKSAVTLTHCVNDLG